MERKYLMGNSVLRTQFKRTLEQVILDDSAVRTTVAPGVPK